MEMVKYLVEEKVSNFDYKTAFVKACGSDNLEVVNYFYEKIEVDKNCLNDGKKKK
jgi:DeoR/GlpR family transcriptional regulator of sugar metabolism